MNQDYDTKVEAVKLLRQLRGVDPAELHSGEIEFVMTFLDKAHSIGWSKGMTQGGAMALALNDEARQSKSCSDGAGCP